VQPLFGSRRRRYRGPAWIGGDRHGAGYGSGLPDSVRYRHSLPQLAIKRDRGHQCRAGIGRGRRTGYLGYRSSSDRPKVAAGPLPTAVTFLQNVVVLEGAWGVLEVPCLAPASATTGRSFLEGSSQHLLRPKLPSCISDGDGKPDYFRMHRNTGQHLLRPKLPSCISDGDGKPDYFRMHRNTGVDRLVMS